LILPKTACAVFFVFEKRKNILNPVKKTLMWGRHQLTLETGEIARQASGAVMVTMEDTVVLVTVVGARNAKPGQDFFPLTVDYQERTYAAGKIPGGFFRREGRPSEKEILTSRLIDRPVRPLFPEGFRNEVQVIATVLSHDLENDPDIVAISALAPEGVPLLQALRNAGYKKAIIGSNGLNSGAVIKGAGAAANGLIVGTSWASWNQTPANKTFIKKFKKAYKSTPDQFAATAYAYTYVLATAAKTGKSATQDAMAANLAAVKGAKTLLGNFSFDANRNGMSPVLVQQVSGGKFGAFKTS
jgi:hypothetical protein